MPKCANCLEDSLVVVIDDRNRPLCYECGKEEAERQTRADAPGVWPDWMPRDKLFVAIHHHKHGEDVAVFKYTPTHSRPTPGESAIASACEFDFETDGSEYIECVPVDKIVEIK